MCMAGKSLGRVLSDRQKAFVSHYLNGATQTAAARAAGYASPLEQASVMIRTPAIQAAIHNEVSRLISSQGVNLAYGHLRKVLAHNLGTIADQTTAARIILDRAGITPQSEPTKQADLADLPSELLREIIDKLEDEKVKRAKTIDNAPDNAPNDPQAVDIMD